MSKAKQPIIIIGMHRSGTSMLSRIISKMGVFIGNNLDNNAESTYFQNLNKWMLEMGRSTWDFPDNYRHVDENYMSHINRAISKRLESFQFMPYWGVKKYLFSKELKKNYNWGWKDPRNSLTLDVWMKIYPGAKILHIYRNPVDVAVSLTKRELLRKGNYRITKKTLIKERLLFPNIKYQPSYYLLHKENAYQLWKAYNQVNQVNCSKYPNQIYTIKYEDLLEKPCEKLREIAKFINASVEEKEISIISKDIDGSRAYDFLNDDNLVEFYNSIKSDEMNRKLGYANII